MLSGQLASAPGSIAAGDSHRPIAVGGMVGAINGALITTLSLPPFIVDAGNTRGNTRV